MCRIPPLRHHDPDSLRAMLSATGLEGDALNEVMQLAKEGHYQKACGAQFRAAHKGVEVSTGMVNHPNQYYTESVSGGAAPGSQGAKRGKSLKTERASVYGADESDGALLEAAEAAERSAAGAAA